MTRATAILSFTALAITACSGSDDGAITDTRMRNVDIVAGTASDEMILLDQASGESTAIDPSVDTGPAAPRPVVADDSADTPSGGGPPLPSDESADISPRDDAADGDRPATSNNGDVVIRPPAPRPAAPRAERDSADAPATKR